MAEFDTSNPRYIWAAPDGDRGDEGGGIGTFDSPFTSVADALQKAAAGQRVVLLPGVYSGDLTIEAAGDEKAPVYITAYKTGEAVIEGGCWYFYDASDLVVSGLTFKNARRGAVAVIGQCLRNRFHAIHFIDCGTDAEASCTLYFGGAGARFNLIEECVFTRGTGNNDNANPERNAAVGLMISDGGDGGFLTNHVVRRNRFFGYGKAIVFGSESESDFESGHIAERNQIANCRFDGITVKCGDAQIRGNIIDNCGNFGIVTAHGRYSTIEGNRISDCGGGILAGGAGISIADNRIIKCKTSAVTAQANRAQNLLVYENHFVNCGTEAAIVINEETTGAIQKNRSYGLIPIISPKSPNKNFTIDDNIEGIDIDEYADDNAGEDADPKDGYIDALTPGYEYEDESEDDISEINDISDINDINEYDDTDDNIANDDEQRRMFNYMFDIPDT